MPFPPVVGRRVLAAMLTAPLAAPALAQGQLSLRGRDNWMFLRWDDPSQIAPLQTRVVGLMRQAAELIRAKGIEVGFLVIPPKTRIYADMLPAGHSWSGPAEQRLATILNGLRPERSGIRHH